MKRTLTATLIAASFALTGSASAAGYNDTYEAGYAWADVLSVEPIISSYDRPVSNQECYQQPVVYREPARYQSARRDRAPAVLGAIVGGVIGNQFGGGHGRDAATAAGALLGYHAVRDDQRRYGGGYVSGGREYTRYENRCTTQTDYVRDETVTGYDVTYRFGGKTYRTTTDYNPGNRIQVEVDVRPVR